MHVREGGGCWEEVSDTIKWKSFYECLESPRLLLVRDVDRASQHNTNPIRCGEPLASEHGWVCANMDEAVDELQSRVEARGQPRRQSPSPTFCLDRGLPHA